MDSRHIRKPQVQQQYWQEVQAAAKPKAKALGITESDINRLVEEYRQEKRSKIIKKD